MADSKKTVRECIKFETLPDCRTMLLTELVDWIGSNIPEEYRKTALTEIQVHNSEAKLTVWIQRKETNAEFERRVEAEKQQKRDLIEQEKKTLKILMDKYSGMLK